MVIHRYLHKVSRPVHKLYVHCPHIEHGGFVALAGSEVFHLGQLIFAINCVLLVAGALAVLYESFHIGELS
jgi:hypothetical protein